MTLGYAALAVYPLPPKSYGHFLPSYQEEQSVSSHFLTLHIGSPAEILELIEREPLATLNQIADLETRRFVERIVTGDYSRDPKTQEHPEGHMFIRAFRALSKLSSKSRIHARNLRR